MGSMCSEILIEGAGLGERKGKLRLWLAQCGTLVSSEKCLVDLGRDEGLLDLEVSYFGQRFIQIIMMIYDWRKMN